jgi:hypothetical protein
VQRSADGRSRLEPSARRRRAPQSGRAVLRPHLRAVLHDDLGRLDLAALLCRHLLECGSASASRAASLCRHPLVVRLCATRRPAAPAPRREAVELCSRRAVKPPARARPCTGDGVALTLRPSLEETKLPCEVLPYLLSRRASPALPSCDSQPSSQYKSRIDGEGRGRARANSVLQDLPAWSL